MKNPFSLKGETALITGGGTGLGLGIPTCSVQAGARVVLTGRRADVLASAPKKLGRAAAFEAQDIARYDELDVFPKRVQREAGKISILVNNAGIHLKKPAMDITAPMNRFGTAVDIGLAATYLRSPAASFVTGAVLPVDGGASIGF